MTTVWTPIPKPANTSSVIGLQFSGGTPVGMLMGITQSSLIGITSVITGIWTDVPKPSTLTWTNVSKAT